MSCRVLCNQIGIEASALTPPRPLQRVLVVGPSGGPLPGNLELIGPGLAAPLRLELRAAGPTFRGEEARSANLPVLAPGEYLLHAEGASPVPLEVGERLLLSKTLPAVLEYFRRQRCGSPWDEADRNVGFFGGRADRVDVHGGWYDASGDVSKYLSHLSYANFFNPQQTPLVVWALLEHLERRRLDARSGAGAELLEEARYGADFLCRMHDPAGYFYMTVFDRWSKRTEEREICAYKTQQGIKLDSYQAGYRQGGGMAIAALARTARVLREQGEASSVYEPYADHARSGFAHLEAHNLEYLDDGKENIIDDYCALLATAELYAYRPDEDVLAAARRRASGLVGRLRTDGPLPGWFRADDGDRPFFHASDAGLPVVALLRWAELEPEPRAKVRLLEAVEESLRFELSVTAEVNNPYGLARQYVQWANGRRATAFFLPHDNETGYWWQGENARLASLATAAGLYCRIAGSLVGSGLRRDLLAFAYDQLDWILGKNPFDACMLHGFGRNNVEYMTQWPNCPGGICNGITSGYDDEQDVDFARTEGLVGDHSWRWREQWLPHAAWYLAALSALD